jgi:hypothetical protein
MRPNGQPLEVGNDIDAGATQADGHNMIHLPPGAGASRLAGGGAGVQALELSADRRGARGGRRR